MKHIDQLDLGGAHLRSTHRKCKIQNPRLKMHQRPEDPKPDGFVTRSPDETMARGSDLSSFRAC
jgi:hypothetical protein